MKKAKKKKVVKKAKKSAKPKKAARKKKAKKTVKKSKKVKAVKKKAQAPAPKSAPIKVPGKITWKSKPSKEEVEAGIRTFFQVLQSGELDRAQAMVDHAYPDWNESIHLVWQDHYLLYEVPDDSSFEGNLWKNDTTWLKDLKIKDTLEWINPNCVWADLIYRDRASGYVGEFSVLENDGQYTLTRTIFKMA